MVNIALIAPHSGQDFRQDDTKHFRILKQRRYNAAPAQQFQQFFPDALNRHFPQKALSLKDGICCL